MVDFERQIVELLRQAAIFADVTGTTPDKFFQVAIHCYTSRGAD
ncbi:MAG TPA: hypothetical protein PLY87_26390 [Planctomycetaceae bacterium]|nr:hypothetical protein [Planctomycetaceae bacterium]HQZ68655.1 hypothetical protein [Planctomycetaceae bacterium]